MMNSTDPHLQNDSAPSETAAPTSSGRVIPHKHLTGILRVYVAFCHVLPSMGAVAAVVSLFFVTTPWPVFVVAVVMWALTCGIGISVGFHRLFSHRAFQSPTWVKFVIGVCGSMAGQGPLLAWVALHRRHHEFSDMQGDPHSPHLAGAGWRNRLRGFWHAHFGWVTTYDMPDPLHYAPDLLRVPALGVVNRWFLTWYLLGLALPAVVCGGLGQSWTAAGLGLLWGGCFRVAFSSQVTWSINSICHLFGMRPNATNDHSRNVAWLSVFSFGESWHNNHHAAPASARFGWRWWQIDLGYWFIQLLKVFRLATDVKT